MPHSSQQKLNNALRTLSPQQIASTIQGSSNAHMSHVLFTVLTLFIPGRLRFLACSGLF